MKITRVCSLDRWRRSGAAGLLVPLLTALALTRASAIQWTMNHFDPGRDGANLNEAVLTTGNVNSTTFGKAFDRAVDGEIYAEPLAMDNVSMNDGAGPIHEVVYVATTKDLVYCFDAEDPTQLNPLWKVNLGPPVLAANVQCCCTDMSIWCGITGTPVIDPSTGTMYLVTKNESSGGVYSQSLHALDITTGAEKFGGPKQISATVSGVTFDPQRNHQRIGLLLQGGNVYIGWSSHNDCTPYSGWIMGYSASTLAQVGAWPDTASGGSGGIWMSGGGLVGDGSSIYFTTGNGNFDLNTGGVQAGECFVRLNSSCVRQDYFSPHNEAALTSADLDLGGGGIMLIPGTQRLIGGGKGGFWYLVNTTSMGGFNASTDACIQSFMVTDPTQSLNHLHGGPVYFSNGTSKWAYTWGESDHCKAYAWNGTTFPTTPSSESSFTDPLSSMPGGALTISANGTSNGILWGNAVDSGNANHNTEPGILYAFDATNLNTLLWSSYQNQARDDFGAFAKNPGPVVVNGKVYQATFGMHLAAYGLFPTPAGTKYEAENGVLAGGAAVANNHNGYSGTGFVDGFEAVGASDTMTVSVSVAGPYYVRLHYANAFNSLNQQQTQTMSVYVNGSFATQISMPDMGTWDYWGDVTSTLNLNAGSNTIAYEYTSSDTAHTNLDYIVVTSAALRYEAESLPVAAVSSGDSMITMSDTQLSGASGSQLAGSGTSSFVTYTVSVPEARTYDIKLRLKDWNNRGIFQLAIAPTLTGTYTNHGNPVDQYNANPTYTLVDIGQVTFGTSGSKSFKFSVTGKNAASTGYDTAIDYMLLIPN